MVRQNYYLLKPKLQDSVLDSSEGVSITYSTVKKL